MIMIEYANGYGRRDPVPECNMFTREIEISCPCCNGEGRHAFGAGMDTDSVPCEFCDEQAMIEVKVEPVG